MTEHEAIAKLERIGAVRTGHFVFTNGDHSTTYVDKRIIAAHTLVMAALCRTIAAQFLEDTVETVVAPAIGGIPMTQWVAHALENITFRVVNAVWAEKDVHSATGFSFPSQVAHFVEGKRCLVLDDTITTGGSAEKVVRLTRQAGGNVIGFGAIWNRKNVKPADLGNPGKTFFLINRYVESWPKDQCPHPDCAH